MSKPMMTLFVVCLAAACKPAADSTLADAATATSFKSGFFMPMKAADYALTERPGNRKMSVKELAARAGYKINPAKEKSLSVAMSYDGENVLVLKDPRLDRVPLVSIDRNGSVYAWSAISAHYGNKVSISSIFIKHRPDQEPVPTIKNQYVLRFPDNKGGLKEPILVPWLNHVRSETGDIITYRVGNTIIEARTELEAFRFESIGNNVWVVKGIYRDKDVMNGTVFWSENLVDFYSLTPGANFVTKWRKQDADSMDRLTRVEKDSVRIPKIVQRRTTRGLALAGDKDLAYETNRGINAFLMDRSVIPLFDPTPTGGAGPKGFVDVEKKAAKGFGLTGEDWDAQFEWDETKVPSFALAGNILSHEQFMAKQRAGQKLAPGTRVQTADGTIVEVIRPKLNDGWNRDYYTYDVKNVSSDKDGKLGHIAYDLDYYGETSNKRHMRTQAAEMVRDIQKSTETINNAQATATERSEEWHKNAEIYDKQFAKRDSYAKVAAHTGAYVLESIASDSDALKKFIPEGADDMVGENLKRVDAVKATVKGTAAGIHEYANSGSAGAAAITGFASFGSDVLATDGMSGALQGEFAKQLGKGAASAWKEGELPTSDEIDWTKQATNSAIGFANTATGTAFKGTPIANVSKGVADIATQYNNGQLTVGSGAASAAKVGVDFIPSKGNPLVGVVKGELKMAADLSGDGINYVNSMSHASKTGAILDDAIQASQLRQDTQAGIAGMDASFFEGLGPAQNGYGGIPPEAQRVFDDPSSYDYNNVKHENYGSSYGSSSGYTGYDSYDFSGSVSQPSYDTGVPMDGSQL